MIKVNHGFSFSIIILIVLSPEFVLFTEISTASEWTTNGIQITDLSSNQEYSKLITDNSGGAIVAWEDFRNGSNYDIYIQNVDSNGNPTWDLNGRVLVNASGDQRDVELIQSGTGAEGKVFIVWEDRRNSNSDIYMQMINILVPSKSEPINILLILLVVGLIGILSVIGIIYLKKKKSKTVKG